MTKDDRQAFEVPDRLFEYVRAVVDNRALATVLLFLLSLLLIGIDNIARNLGGAACRLFADRSI